MAIVKCKDRDLFEDAFVSMIKACEEWTSLWSIMMHGIGIDDTITNTDEGSITMHCDHMSFKDFLQMFPEEYHRIFEEVET